MEWAFFISEAVTATGGLSALMALLQVFDNGRVIRYLESREVKTAINQFLDSNYESNSKSLAFQLYKDFLEARDLIPHVAQEVRRVTIMNATAAVLSFVLLLQDSTFWDSLGGFGEIDTTIDPFLALISLFSAIKTGVASKSLRLPKIMESEELRFLRNFQIAQSRIYQMVYQPRVERINSRFKNNPVFSRALRENEEELKRLKSDYLSFMKGLLTRGLAAETGDVRIDVLNAMRCSEIVGIDSEGTKDGRMEILIRVPQLDSEPADQNLIIVLEGFDPSRSSISKEVLGAMSGIEGQPFCPTILLGAIPGTTPLRVKSSRGSLNLHFERLHVVAPDANRKLVSPETLISERKIYWDKLESE